MLRTYQSDRHAFIEAAKKYGAEVRVFTDTRVIPRAQGTVVAMQPVILLHYELDFEEDRQDQRWVFEEFLDDQGGKLNIAGSLLDDLDKDPQLLRRPKVLDRTMALPPRP